MFFKYFVILFFLHQSLSFPQTMTNDKTATNTDNDNKTEMNVTPVVVANDTNENDVTTVVTDANNDSTTAVVTDVTDNDSTTIDVADNDSTTTVVTDVSDVSDNDSTTTVVTDVSDNDSTTTDIADNNENKNENDVTTPVIDIIYPKKHHCHICKFKKIDINDDSIVMPDQIDRDIEQESDISLDKILQNMLLMGIQTLQRLRFPEFTR